MRAEVGIPVSEAAARLGVTEPRVRAMIYAGILDAKKIGDRWHVDPASVERRKSTGAHSGRTLTTRNAWTVLFLAAGEKYKSARWIKNLSPWARSRMQSRLRKDDLQSLAPYLRGRAATYRFRAHPGDLDQIAKEPGIVRGGISAASDYRIDIIANGEIEIYIPAERLPKLVKKYFLEVSATPNVIIHVVEGFWPFSPSSKVVPPIVAAIDLIEAEDERSRRAGEELLRRSHTK